MKRFIIIIFLFGCSFIAWSQSDKFYEESKFDTLLLPTIEEDLWCNMFYRSGNYCIDNADTIKDFYLFCDSIQSVVVRCNPDFFFKYFPLMHNLKHGMVSGYFRGKYKNCCFPISSDLEYLWLNETILPLTVDYSQFKKSLKVLQIHLIKRNFNKKSKAPYHFDFSEFDSLKFLSICIQPYNSSYITITFPPNLYDLEWSVLPQHVGTHIPKSVEILHLIIKDNVFPTELYQLPHLRYLGLISSAQPVILPENLLSITSLQSLEIDNFSEQNINIISQMPQLDSLFIINAHDSLPINIFLLKNIKYIEFWYYSDYNIAYEIKRKFPLTTVVIQYSTRKEIIR